MGGAQSSGRRHAIPSFGSSRNLLPDQVSTISNWGGGSIVLDAISNIHVHNNPHLQVAGGTTTTHRDFLFVHFRIVRSGEGGTARLLTPTSLPLSPPALPALPALPAQPVVSARIGSHSAGIRTTALCSAVVQCADACPLARTSPATGGIQSGPWGRFPEFLPRPESDQNHFPVALCIVGRPRL